MGKLFTGFVVGIMVSSVGFNGVAQIGNRAVQTIQSIAVSTSQPEPQQTQTDYRY